MFSKTTIFVTASLVLASSASPAKKRKEVEHFASIITSCTVPNTAALTFDDGPYIYLEDISDTLKAANATGTFFWNGDNYDCIYNQNEVKRVRYAYDQGHQVASHTWAHEDLATLSYDAIDAEVTKVNVALQKILGVVPAFIRPPYGSYNNLVQQVARDRGQQLVLWDFDSGDSTGATVAQSKRGYDNVIAQHPGTILSLNHEVYETTAHKLLPYAITELQNAGYKLVSLSECLNLPAYLSIVPRGTRDSSWQC